MQNYAIWTHTVLLFILKQDFHEDIADDVEKRFDISNYECNRPLPTGKNKKVIGLMKDESGGNIMTEIAALRPKTYSYIMDGSGTHVTKKKAKGKEKCVIKKYLSLMIIKTAY